jgi:hypothetical protein
LKKKLTSFAIIFSLLFGIFQAVPVSADSFYEGTGMSKAKCNLTKTFSASEVKKMGDAYSKMSGKLTFAGAVSSMTPLIGKYLAFGAATMMYSANVQSNTLISKGKQGYKAKEYNCSKVKWDGYSRRTYVKYKFVK